MDTPAPALAIHLPKKLRDDFMCITETVIPVNAKKHKITTEQTIDGHFYFEKMIAWELIQGGLSIVGAMAGEREIFNWSEKNPSKVYTFDKSAIGNGFRVLFQPGENLTLFIRNDLGRETKIAITAFGSVVEAPSSA